MKPAFDTLKKNFYSSTLGRPNYVDAASVFNEMGISYENLLKENPAYENTCAVRMSLALLKSGVSFAGRMMVNSGPYKGRKIEPGAKLLADQLMRSDVLGRPQFIDVQNPIKQLTGKKGIIFFWKITGYGGGHIDLIELEQTIAVCQSNCFFACKEIWFWPLQ